jgi:hypothetical protein
VPVRLGHGAFTRGVLDAATIDAAVAAFQHFRASFDRHAVTRYRAVATSAVRTADNRDVLLHRLAHEAGIELDIIDGDEEARLVRKAVAHAFASPTVAALRDRSRRRQPRGQPLRSSAQPLARLLGADRHGPPARDDGPRRARSATDEAGMVRRYVATVWHRDAAIRELGVAAACGGNAEALARLFGATAEVGGHARLRAGRPRAPAARAAGARSRRAWSATGCAAIAPRSWGGRAGAGHGRPPARHHPPGGARRRHPRRGPPRAGRDRGRGARR